MMQAVALDMPLRGLAMMSGGRLDFETLDALICFMNGNYPSGFRRLLKHKRKEKTCKGLRSPLSRPYDALYCIIYCLPDCPGRFFSPF